MTNQLDNMTTLELIELATTTTSKKMLTTLLHDYCWDVRLAHAVVQNEKTSKKTLLALTKDSDQDVSEMAKQRLA